ncbi:LysM peptidoglycan-binding domain-containing protein [Reichenbachiella sp.]|uniref:CIS tube protein n=1 Tax=Reichenbachiella sp. TaxID=2184521 RepID=UPI00329A0BE5
MLGFAQGKLEKLTILSFKDNKYSQDQKKFTVLINPDSYAEDYKIKYTEPKAAGTKIGSRQFDRVLPQNLSLKLVFDSTGIVSDGISFGGIREEPKSVPVQLKEFMSRAFDYNGETHEPRYLKIIWGKNKRGVFKGRLDSVNVKYTLFESDGTPLRAIADAKLTGSIDKETELKDKVNSSPDLTHIRTVKEGDTLPLMTYRIYGDASYYLEVARVNKLSNIRQLKAGTKILFPPIDKKRV